MNDNLVLDYTIQLIQRLRERTLKNRMRILESELEAVSRIIDRVRYWPEPEQYNKAILIENLLDHCKTYNADPLPLLKSTFFVLNWRA
jgi:hypothetical protein